MVHVCSFPCGFRVNYLKTPWFVWSLVEEKGKSLEGGFEEDVERCLLCSGMGVIRSCLLGMDERSS